MDKEKITNRFWAKVDIGFSDQCWNWKAGCFKGGYGAFKLNKRNRVATHVSWFLTYGTFPEQCLLHSCDNRKCVNPSHLSEGSIADNNRDMVNKGRQVKGENSHLSKLNDADVLSIRRLASKGLTLTSIGQRFGVDRSVIGKIVKGSTWKHI